MRLIYGLCFVLGLLLAAAGMQVWGAAELQTHFNEIAFLTIVAGAWLFVATKLFSWFGLSLRDDVVERKNRAALVALCGAVLAVAFTYIGGNLGEGPSFWNNFYSAGLATVSFFGLWLVLEIGANVSISVAEERDLASGVRLCGLLLAMGLVLGRAAAGDWHSADATLRNFVRDGWFAGLLCAVAMVVERLLRPSRRQPFPAWRRVGVVPGICYVVLAAGWIWYLGRWEGMSRDISDGGRGGARGGQSSLFSPTQTQKKCSIDSDAPPSLIGYDVSRGDQSSFFRPKTPSKKNAGLTPTTPTRSMT